LASPQYDAAGRIVGYVGCNHDITERKQMEIYREISLGVLTILVEPGDLQDSMRRIIASVKARSGLDAVGLRMMDGEDFPYFVQQGFPEDFLLTENSLLERNAAGGLCRDCDGNVCLECTCGLVISGKTDPSSPFCTPGGSFWTTHSFQLLDLPPAQDPRHPPRNQCIHYGYASVALVPIRAKDRIIGLLQLNDRRQGCFSLMVVQQLEGIAAHIGEAMMRVQAEDKLRRSYERLALAQRASGAGLWDWDMTSGRLRWTPEMFLLFGLDPETSTASFETWRGCLHPEDLAAAEERITAAVRDHTRLENDYRIVLPAGEVRWIRASGSTSYDSGGHPLRMAGLCIDTTDRKRTAVALQLALAEKTSLVREIHHRVKNNLAIMISLINMQVRQLKHPEVLAALADTKARLFSMSLLHEMLYRSGRMDRVDVKGYLGSLCGHLEQSLGMPAQGVQILSRLPDALTLEIDQAVPCGLIVSELVSNAIKHAFPGARQGEIMVELVVEEPDSITLCVADNGLGLPDGLKIDQVVTVGLTLVNALTRQLGGTLDILRERGTRFVIRFPFRPTILS
jgi:two-component sensor histidine kinase/PAS domain-containing protein